MPVLLTNRQREEKCGAEEYRGRVMVGLIALAIAEIFLLAGGQVLVNPAIDQTLIGGINAVRFLVAVGILFNAIALEIRLRIVRCLAPFLAGAVVLIVVVACVK